MAVTLLDKWLKTATASSSGHGSCSIIRGDDASSGNLSDGGTSSGTSVATAPQQQLLRLASPVGTPTHSVASPTTALSVGGGGGGGRGGAELPVPDGIHDGCHGGDHSRYYAAAEKYEVKPALGTKDTARDTRSI